MSRGVNETKLISDCGNCDLTPITPADKARLKSRIAALSKADMNAVELAVRVQLALAI